MDDFMIFITSLRPELIANEVCACLHTCKTKTAKAAVRTFIQTDVFTFVEEHADDAAKTAALTTFRTHFEQLLSHHANVYATFHTLYRLTELNKATTAARTLHDSAADAIVATSADGDNVAHGDNVAAPPPSTHASPALIGEVLKALAKIEGHLAKLKADPINLPMCRIALVLPPLRAALAAAGGIAKFSAAQKKTIFFAAAAAAGDEVIFQAALDSIAPDDLINDTCRLRISSVTIGVSSLTPEALAVATAADLKRFADNADERFIFTFVHTLTASLGLGLEVPIVERKAPTHSPLRSAPILATLGATLAFARLLFSTNLLADSLHATFRAALSAALPPNADERWRRLFLEERPLGELEEALRVERALSTKSNKATFKLYTKVLFEASASLPISYPNQFPSVAPTFLPTAPISLPTFVQSSTTKTSSSTTTIPFEAPTSPPPIISPSPPTTTFTTKSPPISHFALWLNACFNIKALNRQRYADGLSMTAATEEPPPFRIGVDSLTHASLIYQGSLPPGTIIDPLPHDMPTQTTGVGNGGARHVGTALVHLQFNYGANSFFNITTRFIVHNDTALPPIIDIRAFLRHGELRMRVDEENRIAIRPNGASGWMVSVDNAPIPTNLPHVTLPRFTGSTTLFLDSTVNDKDAIVCVLSNKRSIVLQGEFGLNFMTAVRPLDANIPTPTKVQTEPIRDARQRSTPSKSPPSTEEIAIFDQWIQAEQLAETTAVLLREAFFSNPILFRLLTSAKIPSISKTGIHRIVLKHDADLSAVKSGRRRRSPVAQEEVDKLRRQLLAATPPRIRRNRFAFVRNAPVVAPKTNASGETTGWRVAIDFRALNDQTLADVYPTPEAYAMALANSQYPCRSTLDCLSQFFSFELDVDSIPLTATDFGDGEIYEWLVSPFGLKSLPATIQRTMDTLLYDLPNADAYVDDVIVGHTSASDDAAMVNELVAVLLRLAEEGLQLSWKKSHLFRKRAAVLGYDVHHLAVEVNEEKRRSILDEPLPTTSQQVTRFCNRVSYYNQFLPNLAHILAPLRSIGARPGRLAFNAEEAAAFEAAQDLLRNAVAITGFRNGMRTHLETDYSVQGISYSLIQYDDDGRRHVVDNASRVTTAAEQRYKRVPKGELLAFRWAITRCRHWLANHPFVWECDSEPCGAIVKGGGDVEGEMVKNFIFELQGLDFTFLWRRGADAHAVDGPSRNPAQTFFSEAQRSQFLNAYTNDYSITHYRLRADLRRRNNAEAARLDALPDDDAKCAYYDGDGFIHVRNDHGTPIVVPYKERRKVLYSAHTSAHKSAVKMLAAIGGVYFWPDMTRQINDYVAVHCAVCCQSRQAPAYDNQGTPQLYGKFESVQVDIFGPFPFYDESKNAHQIHVATFVDEATLAYEAVPLLTKAAVPVALAFEREWIYRYGPPKRVVGDQAFANAVFKELASRHAFTFTPTPPHDENARGIVERSHRTIGSMLAKDIGERLKSKKLSYDEAVSAIARARYHFEGVFNRTRMTTPFQLKHGQHQRGAFEAQLGVSAPDVIRTMSVASNVAEEGHRTAVLNDAARMARAQAAKRPTPNNAKELAVGDVVTLRAPITATKLVKRRYDASAEWRVVQISQQGTRCAVTPVNAPLTDVKWVSVRNVHVRAQPTSKLKPPPTPKREDVEGVLLDIHDAAAMPPWYPPANDARARVNARVVEAGKAADELELNNRRMKDDSGAGAEVEKEAPMQQRVEKKSPEPAAASLKRGVSFAPDDELEAYEDVKYDVKNEEEEEEEEEEVRTLEAEEEAARRAMRAAALPISAISPPVDTAERAMNLRTLQATARVVLDGDMELKSMQRAVRASYAGVNKLEADWKRYIRTIASSLSLSELRAELKGWLSCTTLSAFGAYAEALAERNAQRNGARQ